MKYRLLFLGFFLVTTAMRAQVYLGVSGGYGIPLAKETIGSEVIWDSTYHSIISVRGSYGAGQNYTLYGGYSLNENLAIELGVNYLSGKKYTSTSTNNQADYSYKNMNQVKSLRLITSIRFTYGEKRIKYYIKGGILTGVFSRKFSSYSQIQDINTVEGNSMQYGNLMLGVSTAIGTCFYFNPHLALFFETNAVGTYWSPDKGKTLKYDVNGVNSISTLPTGPERYVPKAEKYFMPMSAVGLSIGVHFNF
jgi:hypothetical protein